jgi:hypothetical protein
LYVINFRHEQIDILDPLKGKYKVRTSNTSATAYHNKIGKTLLQGLYKIFSILTSNRMPDFSNYTRYLYPTPQQADGSNDCLFYVMSFLEKYNADERELNFNSLVIS